MLYFKIAFKLSAWAAKDGTRIVANNSKVAIIFLNDLIIVSPLSGFSNLVTLIIHLLQINYKPLGYESATFFIKKLSL